jgi:hypothetical protein
MAAIGFKDADLVLKLIGHPHTAQRVQLYAYHPAEC